LLGRYPFAVPEAVARGELRPLLPKPRLQKIQGFQLTTPVSKPSRLRRPFPGQDIRQPPFGGQSDPIANSLDVPRIEDFHAEPDCGPPANGTPELL
jgi:hypothetical protein